MFDSIRGMFNRPPKGDGGKDADKSPEANETRKAPIREITRDNVEPVRTETEKRGREMRAELKSQVPGLEQTLKKALLEDDAQGAFLASSALDHIKDQLAQSDHVLGFNEKKRTDEIKNKEGKAIADREREERFEEAFSNAPDEKARFILREQFNNPGMTAADAHTSWILQEAGKESADREQERNTAFEKMKEAEHTEQTSTALNNLLKRKNTEYSVDDYKKILAGADAETKSNLTSYFGMLKSAAGEIAQNNADELTGSGQYYIDHANEWFEKFDAVIKEAAKKQGITFTEKPKEAELPSDTERISDAMSERLTMILGDDSNIKVDLVKSFDAIAEAILTQNQDAQYSIPSLRTELKRTIPGLARDAIINFPKDSGHRETFDQACEQFQKDLFSLASRSHVDLKKFV